MRARAALVLVVGLGVSLVACGDDDPEATPTTSLASAPSTSAATTSTAASTVPTSTNPTTTATAVATTTEPTTIPDTEPATVAPTTTPTGAGWQPVAFVEAVSPVGYSGNYLGTASPPMPSDPATPLADGYYAATLLEPWSPDQPAVLHVEVASFQPCSSIGDACYENESDPTELGIDPSNSRAVDVPLDDSTRVIVRGFRCFDTDEVKRGSGADLRDLLSAYDADYTATMLPLFRSDAGFEAITAAAAASPNDGFVTPESVCQSENATGAGLALFEHGTAPLLLMQTISYSDISGDERPLGATDLVRLNGVEVGDGVMTFYFYAGFYS